MALVEVEEFAKSGKKYLLEVMEKASVRGGFQVVGGLDSGDRCTTAAITVMSKNDDGSFSEQFSHPQDIKDIVFCEGEKEKLSINALENQIPKVRCGDLQEMEVYVTGRWEEI